MMPNKILSWLAFSLLSNNTELYLNKFWYTYQSFGFVKHNKTFESFIGYLASGKFLGFVRINKLLSLLKKQKHWLFPQI